MLDRAKRQLRKESKALRPSSSPTLGDVLREVARGNTRSELSEASPHSLMLSSRSRACVAKAYFSRGLGWTLMRHSAGSLFTEGQVLGS